MIYIIMGFACPKPKAERPLRGGRYPGMIVSRGPREFRNVPKSRM